MRKRLIASALIACMALGFAGCAKKGFSEDKLAKYAKNELELEELDVKKAEKKIQKLKKQDYYFSAEAKDIKKLLWKEVELEDYFASPKGAESATAFITGSPNKKIELATILTFESSDDALKFMEKTEDLWDDNDDWDDCYSDKENENMAAIYDDEDGFVLVCGAYRKGNSVLIVIGSNEDHKSSFKNVEGICEEFDVEYAEDLL